MNRKTFSTLPKAPTPDAVNEAGGLAYSRAPKEALAQYALTGCFNDTFYASAEDQLQKTLALCKLVNDPAYIAKLAVYAREKGRMKDMPAFLLAWLAVQPEDSAGIWFRAVFPRCIDNVKQLSKFTQVIRSGVLGRKSMGSRITKAINRWIAAKSGADLWWQSIGVADPSLADIIRLTHPNVQGPEREHLYAYLLGKEKTYSGVPIDREHLPTQVQAWLSYKPGDKVPNVPFQLLVGQKDEDWRSIALLATWAQTRQLLNSFGRKGLWKDKEVVDALAKRLTTPPPGTLPYQILTTYQNTSEDTPRPLVNALHAAMEAACSNVPEVPGGTLIAVDVSGSMRDPVTGKRQGSTTKTRCVDVAALFASAILRKQPEIAVLAFDTNIYLPKLEPLDTVLTNAGKLAAFGGGGTDCSLPIMALQKGNHGAELVVYISDNESWFGKQAGMAQAWAEYSRYYPKCKLVCIDLTPDTTTQVRTGRNVWNFGGFSDAVFDLVGMIARGEMDAGFEARVNSIS